MCTICTLIADKWIHYSANFDTANFEAFGVNQRIINIFDSIISQGWGNTSREFDKGFYFPHKKKLK